MQRAELHFHLLPGVDDGPVDLADAVELARLAVADGTALVTVTPHVRDLRKRGMLGEVPERVREVQGALDAAGVPLQVQAGAELAHDDLPALGDADLDAIAHGPPGRRWVLIEAPLFGDAPEFLDATAELRARGYGTLIGHPERCAELMRDDGAIARERAAGALLQINASSLTGRHGERRARLGDRAAALRRRGRDRLRRAPRSRPPLLSAALDVLAGAGMARSALEPLVAGVPRALLADGIAPLCRAA